MLPTHHFVLNLIVYTYRVYPQLKVNAGTATTLPAMQQLDAWALLSVLYIKEECMHKANGVSCPCAVKAEQCGTVCSEQSMA